MNSERERDKINRQRQPEQSGSLQRVLQDGIATTRTCSDSQSVLQLHVDENSNVKTQLQLL